MFLCILDRNGLHTFTVLCIKYSLNLKYSKVHPYSERPTTNNPKFKICTAKVPTSKEPHSIELGFGGFSCLRPQLRHPPPPPPPPPPPTAIFDAYYLIVFYHNSKKSVSKPSGSVIHESPQQSPSADIIHLCYYNAILTTHVT
jgi:hypothetical protein